MFKNCDTCIGINFHAVLNINERLAWLFLSGSKVKMWDECDTVNFKESNFKVRSFCGGRWCRLQIVEKQQLLLDSVFIYWNMYNVITRPSVINWSIDYLNEQSFSPKSSKHRKSRTIRARDLNFCTQCSQPVMCHVSCVTCQVSCVRCHVSMFFYIIYS